MSYKFMEVKTDDTGATCVIFNSVTSGVLSVPASCFLLGCHGGAPIPSGEIATASGEVLHALTSGIPLAVQPAFF